MGVSIAGATLIFSGIINTIPVRSALGLPTVPPTGDVTKKVTYEAPRTADASSSQGMRERLTSSLNDAKKGFSDQMSSYTGSYSATEQERAEKKRKELLRKLEENRKVQEREEFEKKYKGKQ
jgi:YidC/Oxa1 family membrane protein insertase